MWVLLMVRRSPLEGRTETRVRFLLQVLTRLRVSFFLALEMVMLKEKLPIEGRFAHFPHPVTSWRFPSRRLAWMLYAQGVLCVQHPGLR